MDWGDGSPTEAATVDQQAKEVSGSHAYQQDGAFLVTVTVIDDDGRSASGSFTATVSNLPPAVTAATSLAADEGSTSTHTLATFTDPGVKDTHTATINWGDGSPTEAAAVDQQAKEISGSHSYQQDGTFPATVTVTDDGGESASGGFTATVSNLPPVVTGGTELAADEGSAATHTLATFTDPGAQDTHTATVDWGDGSATEAATVDQQAKEVSGSHAYQQNGTFLVTVTVTDDDGGSAPGTFIATVSNLPPVVTPATGLAAIEGTASTLTLATFTDPGDNDTHTATVNWGDGSATEAATVDQQAGEVTGSHTYADDGTFSVAVTVTDDGDKSAAESFTATVSNLPPVVIAETELSTFELWAAPLTLATFTDLGVLDTHTAAVDWGDGSPLTAATVQESGGSGSVTGGHSYAAPGDYTGTVTVTDKDGGENAVGFAVEVAPAPPISGIGPWGIAAVALAVVATLAWRARRATGQRT